MKLLNDSGTFVDVPEIDGKTNINEAVDITYENLMIAISGSTLVAGQSYKITDYSTVHQIPNTTDINKGDTEPLIVTAIATNELAPIAYSTVYPDDIIYYNPVNDATKITGSIKGYIYRRIDTKQNNDIPFDFRSVKFRRWQIEQPDWIVDTTYAKGVVVKKPYNTELYVSLVNDSTGNPVSDTAYWRQFEWNNLDYVSPTVNNWYIVDDAFQIALTCTTLYTDYNMFTVYDDTIYSNKIDGTSGNILETFNSVVKGTNFYNNSIGTSFSSNTIGANFQNNSIGVGFYNNSIGAYFYNNTIGANFQNNTIGANFNNNTIESNFQNNSIGVGFNSNSIESNFYNNSIGVNFQSNSIGVGFYNNTIEANFQNNHIGTNFYSNTIGADFSSNTTGAGFYSNTIGADFNNNTIGTEFYYNSIGASFSSNTIGANFYNNSIGVGFYNNTIGNSISGFTCLLLGVTKNRFEDGLNFTGIDFTLATHLTGNYNCTLYTDKTDGLKLSYVDVGVTTVVAVNA